MKKNNRYLTKKKWSGYLATSIVEGFSDKEPSQNEVHDAWQYLVDSGLWLQLQGSTGRMANELIKSGFILPPEKSQTDAYGNEVKFNKT